MSSSPCQCKEAIRREALAQGASACGFAEAGPVDAADVSLYESWIATGRHGSMDYCAKYREQRSDPRLLLDGARTLIVCAFGYNNGGSTSSIISRYAWGDDYHWVIKSRLMDLAEYITGRYGGECRAVVDTAPLRERYWAQQAGIGFIGVNGQLILPGAGSYYFIGTLLWTGEVPADVPSTGTCDGCMSCVKACPGGALDGTGGCDARRCLSYLTIEHRGDLPDDAPASATVYGCDVCQRVCPHNSEAPLTTIPEFKPNPEIVTLTAEDIIDMTPSHYKRLVAHSAMRRIPLKQLVRNLSILCEDNRG